MHASQDALIRQVVQVTADGHLRMAGEFGKFGNAHLPFSPEASHDEVHPLCTVHDSIQTQNLFVFALLGDFLCVNYQPL